MRTHNRNLTITHLAMPERQIPVLIDAGPKEAEGFVPSITWSDKRQTGVRRLLPSFVDGLRNPSRHREIEQGYGAISKAEWNRLSELFKLIDRINAGDWSPIVTTDAEEVLSGLPAILNELSPEGWFMESEPDTGEIRFKSVSGNVRSSFSYKIEQVPEHPSIPADVSTKPERRTASPNFSASKRDGQTVMQWSGEISGECKTAAFALSEAFTAGLSKTRFVVWWSELSKKFVPGLYCPDIVTALYALAMWSSGTAGGWAICQKCSKDFARKRAKQLYCSARCQTAAGMNRLRQKQKATTAVKPNTAIGRNRHPGEAAI
jgi:hypothetical protein